MTDIFTIIVGYLIGSYILGLVFKKKPKGPTEKELREFNIWKARTDRDNTKD